MAGMPEAGDYSLILLRKVINGKLVTIPIEEFLRGNEKDPIMEPTLYTLKGAFDVNGDGKMEMVIGWQYISGSGSEICEVKGNKVIQVLSSGGGV